MPIYGVHGPSTDADGVQRGDAARGSLGLAHAFALPHVEDASTGNLGRRPRPRGERRARLLGQPAVPRGRSGASLTRLPRKRAGPRSRKPTSGPTRPTGPAPAATPNSTRWVSCSRTTTPSAATGRWTSQGNVIDRPWTTSKLPESFDYDTNGDGGRRPGHVSEPGELATQLLRRPDAYGNANALSTLHGDEPHQLRARRREPGQRRAPRCPTIRRTVAPCAA